jgi:hypothetical protein
MTRLPLQPRGLSLALALPPPPPCGSSLRHHLRRVGSHLGRITARYLPQREPKLPPAFDRAILADNFAKLHARRSARTAMWANGRQFLIQSGERAAALRWVESDVFGLPPVPPNPHPAWRGSKRVDQLGLVWPCVITSADRSSPSES